MRTVVGVRSGHQVRRALNHGNDSACTVWFNSWCRLAGVLSDENRALLRLIRDRQPLTVTELAGLSGRAASNLRILGTDHSLVRFHRSPDTRSGAALFPPGGGAAA